MQTDIVAIILAGGQSRRMGGGDKALMRFGRATLMDNAIGKLSRQVETIVINANGDPGRFVRFNLPIIADDDAGGAFPGPLGGILAGLRWVAANEPLASHVMSVACDTPFFPDDLATKFVAAASAGRSIVIASSDTGTHQAFGLWPTALADDLALALRSGTRRVMDWARQHGAGEVNFPPSRGGAALIDPFFNVNTPEDLAAANRLADKD